MVYGVRNNRAACYYKDFLVDWFAKRPVTTQLYLACSRAIEAEETPKNVQTIKGYVQDVLKRFSLQEWAVQPNEIIEDEQMVDQCTNILICGNKNALQKSVFENLKISAHTLD